MSVYHKAVDLQVLDDFLKPFGLYALLLHRFTARRRAPCSIAIVLSIVVEKYVLKNGRVNLLDSDYITRRTSTHRSRHCNLRCLVEWLAQYWHVKARMQALGNFEALDDYEGIIFVYSLEDF